MTCCVSSVAKLVVKSQPQNYWATPSSQFPNPSQSSLPALSLYGCVYTVEISKPPFMDHENHLTMTSNFYWMEIRQCFLHVNCPLYVMSASCLTPFQGQSLYWWKHCWIRVTLDGWTRTFLKSLASYFACAKGDVSWIETSKHISSSTPPQRVCSWPHSHRLLLLAEVTWAEYAAAVGNSRPNNSRPDLVNRTETRLCTSLNEAYVMQACRGAWDRRRRSAVSLSPLTELQRQPTGVDDKTCVVALILHTKCQIHSKNFKIARTFCQQTSFWLMFGMTD